MSKFL